MKAKKKTKKLTIKEKKLYNECIRDLKGVSNVKTISSMNDAELLEFVRDLKDTRVHIENNKGDGFEYADMTLKGLEISARNELSKRNL